MGSAGGSIGSVGDAGSFKHRQLRKQQGRTHAAAASVLDAGGAISTSQAAYQTSSEGTVDQTSHEQWAALEQWANLPETNPNYEPELWSELRDALASVRGQLRQDEHQPR